MVSDFREADTPKPYRGWSKLKVVSPILHFEDAREQDRHFNGDVWSDAAQSHGAWDSHKWF